MTALANAALLVMTDGRLNLIRQTIASAQEHLDGEFSRYVIHDDSNDPMYRANLRGEFPSFEIIFTTKRAGFGGAIANAWEHLRDDPDLDFVFHLEDDFLFPRPVSLWAMAKVLTWHPHLAQLVLPRQAWNDEEIAAGGVLQRWEALTDGKALDCSDGLGMHWMEHNWYFSTNPCLYRAPLMTMPWPQGQQSEGHFGASLRANGLPWGVPGTQVRFATWGKRDDAPWAEHIGRERAGLGY